MTKRSPISGRTFNRPKLVRNVLRRSCSVQWGMLASLSSAALLLLQSSKGFVSLPRAGKNKRDELFLSLAVSQVPEDPLGFELSRLVEAKEPTGKVCSRWFFVISLGRYIVC